MRIDEGSALTIGELGEAGVLRRVLAELSEASAASIGPGDDCAVVNISGQLAITSDTMIEGPDFRLAWHSGFELGWKLAATNLSDVAAMGATPVGLTVSLAAPADTPVDLLAEIARGLSAACTKLAPGTGVVGGDLGRAPALFAAITAVGEHEGVAPVLRSTAQPGDTVAYAGELGLAGLGLSALFAHCCDADGTAHSRGLAELKQSHPAALRAQLAPNPPIALGRVAALAGATAMMDVSDGLSLDADRLAAASGVRVMFDSALLAAGFGRQHGETVTVEAMLTGGEDHGMLAAFPADVALPEGFVRIGVVSEPAREEVVQEVAAVGEAPSRSGEGAPSSSDEAAPRDAVGATTSRVFLDGVPFTPRGWDPYTVVPPGS